MRLTLNPYAGLKDRHLNAVFDSPSHFMMTIAALEGMPATAQEMKEYKDDDNDFYSGETWQDLLRNSVAGSQDFAKRAEALMSEIESVTYETKKRQRVSSPVGRVCVGAYLAGDPMPARRRVPAKSNHAPISIVVGLNSICTVKTASLEKRGIAIAALIRRLVVDRPVDVYLSRFSTTGFECDDGTNMLVKFPTTPIDPYRLAYLLSSQGFCRGAGFAFHRAGKSLFKKLGIDASTQADANYIKFAGSTKYGQSRNCEFANDVQKFLGTELLYIPGSDPTNADFQLMQSNPVQWINETIASLTAPK